MYTSISTVPDDILLLFIEKCSVQGQSWPIVDLYTRATSESNTTARHAIVFDSDTHSSCPLMFTRQLMMFFPSEA